MSCPLLVGDYAVFPVWSNPFKRLWDGFQAARVRRFSASAGIQRISHDRTQLSKLVSRAGRGTLPA